jgi:hypothetical protein
MVVYVLPVRLLHLQLSLQPRCVQRQHDVPAMESNFSLQISCHFSLSKCTTWLSKFLVILDKCPCVARKHNNI